MVDREGVVEAVGRRAEHELDENAGRASAGRAPAGRASARAVALLPYGASGRAHQYGYHRSGAIAFDVAAPYASCSARANRADASVRNARRWLVSRTPFGSNHAVSSAISVVLSLM